MDLQSIIENYGYAAILIGTFLEGETILVLAGLAAHQGYLVLSWVILAAFLEILIGKVKHYEIQVFAVIALLGLLILTLHFYYRRKPKSQPSKFIC